MSVQRIRLLSHSNFSSFSQICSHLKPLCHVQVQAKKVSCASVFIVRMNTSTNQPVRTRKQTNTQNTYTHAQTRTQTRYTHFLTRARTLTHAHAHAHAHLRTRTLTHTHAHEHTHELTNTHTHEHANTCVLTRDSCLQQVHQARASQLEKLCLLFPLPSQARPMPQPHQQQPRPLQHLP